MILRWDRGEEYELKSFDGIIVGAGHNALVLQAYLSRCGLRTLSIDQSLRPGGGLNTIENPRIPGCRHNLHSFFHRGLTGMPWWTDLNLAANGVEYIEPDLNVAMVTSDGRVLQWWRDFDRTVESFATFSKKDADRLRYWYQCFRPIVEKILIPEGQSPPIDPTLRRTLHLRVKFYAAQVADSGHYPTLWIVGDPNTGMFWRQELDLSPVAFHEIAVPAGLISPDGTLHIECRNYTEASLIFPVDESLEVLFPEGSFLLNFVRSLSVILLWLGLLAALGLTAASILSFPVASFFVFALLIVLFSGNLFSAIVEEGTVSGVDDETGKASWTQFDWFLVPIFASVLEVINTVQAISPIESLAAGRSIPIDKLAIVFLKLGLFIGMPIAGIGMYLFHRNELATSGKNG
ncbi:NAD(P)-binding protein [bacterium]|nr:NAD(P)-binding protein [bacterium]